MNTSAFFDELLKLGAVSDEQAEGALRRLDKLEQQKPTAGQLGRYAAIGAVAKPAIRAVSNVATGQAWAKGKDLKEKLRNVAADAIGGGLGASLIPIARTSLDRQAEMGRLRKYVAERQAPSMPKEEV